MRRYINSFVILMLSTLFLIACGNNNVIDEGSNQDQNSGSNEEKSISNDDTPQDTDITRYVGEYGQYQAKYVIRNTSDIDYNEKLIDQNGEINFDLLDTIIYWEQQHSDFSYEQPEYRGNGGLTQFSINEDNTISTYTGFPDIKEDKESIDYKLSKDPFYLVAGTSTLHNSFDIYRIIEDPNNDYNSVMRVFYKDRFSEQTIFVFEYPQINSPRESEIRNKIN